MDGVIVDQRAMPQPSLAAAGAVLTIDLDAIRENYRRLKNVLGRTRCAGVVKADGYGLGAVEVATALAREGCDTFFVAHLGEGVALRRALGRAGCVRPERHPPGAEDEAVAAGLVAVLNSAVQLAGVARGGTARGRKLPAAVQVDSGMSRLGMAPPRSRRSRPTRRLSTASTSSW